MKKTITISVDVDAWARASEKVSNLSKYLNDCLIGLAGKSFEDRTREQLEAEIQSQRETIQQASIKEAAALESIKQLKADKLARDREALDTEQFKRWICPVCKNENFMDLVRCSSCNLPTRNDPKTTIKGESI